MMFADAYVDLNVADAIGTLLTPTIITNGTHAKSGAVTGVVSTPAPQTQFRVGASQALLPDDVSVYGDTVYPARGLTKSLALTNTVNFSYFEMDFAPPSGTKLCSCGFYIIPGPPNEGASSELYDCLGLYNVNGTFAICQLDSGRGGIAGGYAFNIETTLPATTHSAYLTVTPGALYWCTFRVNYILSTVDWNLYDPNTWTPLSPSPITTTLDTSSTVDFSWTRFGNAEVGTSTGVTYFQHLLFDWTSAKFPLIPNPTPPALRRGNRLRRRFWAQMD